MRYKKFIALPVLVLAMGDAAYAGVIPGFTDLPGLGGSPSAALDYTFDQNGLNGSLTSNSIGGYTLSVTGSGPSAFYLQGISNVYTIAASNYALTAYFTSAGFFKDSTSLGSSQVSITGTLSSTSGFPAGVTAPTSTNLFSASLTGFGYSAAQAAVGFDTQFQTSWANQNVFTGGSGGDVLYLFNQGGVSTGFGPLSGFINELVAGQLSATSFTNVQSLAAVPLPLPAVLFGTGLTALMGFGRQRRNISKSI